MFNLDPLVALLGVLALIVVMFAVAGIVYFVGKKRSESVSAKSLSTTGVDVSDFALQLRRRYENGED